MFELYLKKGLLKQQRVNFKQFEKMRRKRNIFFYESDPFGTLTEAESALKAAAQLVQVIQETIRQENPQLHFGFE